MTAAADVLARLAARGWTMAAAESLTGGMVASSLVDVPGASAVFRGGVVAYATDVKRSVLGVDADLLASAGAVDPEVARQMAAAARRVLGADVGIATTGVAGPEPQDGKAVGTVCLAVVTPEGEWTTTRLFEGDRSRIRESATTEVLTECLARL
ncbi:CinA family protein [Microbacterium sp. NPDC057407]|uniref:CinA family protein n=1 Tax=Microbacterium sp. NPDC057407 TaxID=3346120 RepID=UPI00366B32A2